MNSARRILLEKQKLKTEHAFGLTKGEQAIASVLDEIIAENKRALNSMRELVEEDCA